MFRVRDRVSGRVTDTVHALTLIAVFDSIQTSFESKNQVKTDYTIMHINNTRKIVMFYTISHQ